MSGDPLFDLAGKVVVVTGGLGQLGQSYARALMARGARVAIVENRGSDAELATAFPDADGDRLMLAEADVTNRGAIERALGRIVERWDVPAGLINNAALDSPPDSPAEENGPFEDYPESSWERVMAVNAKGTFLCCQVIGGAMAKVGRGSIVNIGSIYGVVSPDQRLYDFRRAQGETFFKPVAYTASKSALYAFTRYLATYWAPRGLRANMLTLAGVFNDQPAEFLEPYCNKVPLGRMARPDEYDGAVVFLLSEASSYMTGANLVLDGGWTAW